MDPNILITALAGFGGALIGGLAALGGQALQQRAEHRRERARLALEAARADLETRLKHAPGGVPVYPLEYFLVWHRELLDLTAAGPPTLDQLRALEDGLADFRSYARSVPQRDVASS